MEVSEEWDPIFHGELELKLIWRILIEGVYLVDRVCREWMRNSCRPAGIIIVMNPELRRCSITSSSYSLCVNVDM